MNAKTVSINCVNCAGPLNPKGGHKVKVLICDYCGAELDPHKDYALLTQLDIPHKSGATIALGTQGQYRDIAFTVIGYIVYEDTRYKEKWTDYQLYSSTHGYIWLSVEKGHITVSRRTRKSVEPYDHSRLSISTSIRYDDRQELQHFDKYQQRIISVGGELTWRAKRGDTVTSTTAIPVSSDQIIGLSSEYGKTEIEFYENIYPDQKQIREDFDLKKIEKPRGVHPLQPYKKGRLDFLKEHAFMFLMINIVLAFLFPAIWTGKTIVSSTVEGSQLSQGYRSEPFEIKDANKALKLNLRNHHLNNSWESYTITLVPVSDQKQSPGYLGINLSYYEGYDDGYWSEGSRSEDKTFRIDEVGLYALDIKLEESGSTRNNPNKGLEYSLQQGSSRSIWFFAMALFFFFALILGSRGAREFESKRWDNSSLYDDDD